MQEPWARRPPPHAPPNHDENGVVTTATGGAVSTEATFFCLHILAVASIGFGATLPLIVVGIGKNKPNRENNADNIIKTERQIRCQSLMKQFLFHPCCFKKGLAFVPIWIQKRPRRKNIILLSCHTKYYFFFLFLL